MLDLAARRWLGEPERVEGYEPERHEIDRFLASGGQRAVVIAPARLADAFIRTYALERERGYPHRIELVRPVHIARPGSTSPPWFIELQKRTHKRLCCLLVVSSCPEDVTSADIAMVFEEVAASAPHSHVIVATNARPDGIRGSFLPVALAPLKAEFVESELHEQGATHREAQVWLRRFGGSGAALRLAGEHLRAGLTLSELLGLGEALDQPTIRGPEGDVADVDSRTYAQLCAVARDVSVELISALAEAPELLHVLHHRTFEMVLAELFAKQGFEVTLTPQTRDGGADIYLLERRSIGSFLYLVEAKRNAPDRPVGIGVVQRLLGAVEMRGATAGMIATTSYFSRPAQEEQARIPFRLSLHDFAALSQWLQATS